ncbi:MAG: transposase domain-containing protein [Pseudomonadota bacterium]
MRPIAIGRKNWLFAGSLRGGRAAATIYTLVASCKSAGVEVLDYLPDMLVRVATHPAGKIDQLLPMNWARHFAPAAPGWRRGRGGGRREVSSDAYHRCCCVHRRRIGDLRLLGDTLHRPRTRPGVRSNLLNQQSCPSQGLNLQALHGV